PDVLVMQPAKGRATRCVRSAEPGARPAHPGPTIGAFSNRCNSGHKLAESRVGAPRPRRSQVEALASDRSNQSFGEAVLPRRTVINTIRGSAIARDRLAGPTLSPPAYTRRIWRNSLCRCR